MFLDRSPIRSRLPDMRMTDRITRRSSAVGARSAITRAASSLIVSSSASMDLSPSRTFSASSTSRVSSDCAAWQNGGLDKAPHLHDLGPGCLRDPGRTPRRCACSARHSLADPPRDVGFRAGIFGIGEDLRCVVIFHEVAKVEERGLLADARGLLHRVGHDHHRIVAAQVRRSAPRPARWRWGQGPSTARPSAGPRGSVATARAMHRRCC